MALNRYVTEMVIVADEHGTYYNKEAKLAVTDDILLSSLNFFRALGKSPNDMKITVRIGVAKPDEVDTRAVAAELPYGSVTVECVIGGLDVPADSGFTRETPLGDAIVMANAAVIVCFEE